MITPLSNSTQVHYDTTDNTASTSAQPISNRASERLSPAKMEQALNEWAAGAAQGENRIEAKTRILNTYTSGSKVLDLRNLGLKTLPKEIGNLTALTWLELEDNKLTTLPQEIENLTAITWLGLNNNEITNLPNGFSQLKNLKKLDLSNNQLTNLPREIRNLSSLTELNLSYNQLATLSKEIWNLTALTMLHLSDNQITTLPQEIGNLTALRWLGLANNPLTTLPSTLKTFWETKPLTEHHFENFFNSTHKTCLQLYGALPYFTNQATMAMDLSTWVNEENVTPEERAGRETAKTRILEAFTSQAAWLDLENLQLTTLPDALGELSHVKHIELDGNRITALPQCFEKLTQLKLLDLANNPITENGRERAHLRMTEGKLIYGANVIEEGSWQWVPELNGLFLKQGKITSPREYSEIGRFEFVPELKRVMMTEGTTIYPSGTREEGVRRYIPELKCMGVVKGAVLHSYGKVEEGEFEYVPQTYSLQLVKGRAVYGNNELLDGRFGFVPELGAMALLDGTRANDVRTEAGQFVYNAMLHDVVLHQGSVVLPTGEHWEGEFQFEPMLNGVFLANGVFDSPSHHWKEQGRFEFVPQLRMMRLVEGELSRDGQRESGVFAYSPEVKDMVLRTPAPSAPLAPSGQAIREALSLGLPLANMVDVAGRYLSSFGLNCVRQHNRSWEIHRPSSGGRIWSGGISQSRKWAGLSAELRAQMLVPDGLLSAEEELRAVIRLLPLAAAQQMSLSRPENQTKFYELMQTGTANAT